jgi:hypothetical protein
MRFFEKNRLEKRMNAALLPFHADGNPKDSVDERAFFDWRWRVVKQTGSPLSRG